MRTLFIVLFLYLPATAKACGLALLLAVDVSGSVDRQEFDIQMGGLAHALRDGVVADALVSQNAKVALLQWTGASRQKLTIEWSDIGNHDDVLAFATRVDSDERVWRNYSTAIGEALIAAYDAMLDVKSCARKVIDVSGDGVSNEGLVPQDMRPRLNAAGITVNALAIETDDTDLTAYFFEHVITGEGAFVYTANGFDDYPAQIRRKLQRETLRRTSHLNLNEMLK